MVRNVLAAALAAAALFGAALGQTCAAGQLCPADAPCCGLYGDCGVGAFCLGGCDIRYSHEIESCVTAPTCKSGTYKLNSLNDVQTIDRYLGDASKINWQSQGKPVVYEDSLLLTMAQGTVGTLLSSTFYVWYGKICAKMTTSQGKGVVTAFIMMSDVQDEIDFEFVGINIAQGQSNYYSQGVTVYTNVENLTVPNGGNTVEKVHEYCIDWQQDDLTWSIDGDDLRTVKRSDTWNATSKRFDYPQTPSRIMLSLWPAGLPSNEKGTVDWAGGEIDWNSKYMQNGYYYAMVKEVTVDCGDIPQGIVKKGNKAYKYTNRAGTNNTVEVTDELVILGSLYADGENPAVGASTAASSLMPTKSVALVPGGNPGGGGGNKVESTAIPAASSGGGGGGGSSQTAGGNPAASQTSSGDNSFSQGGGSTGTGSSVEPSLRKVGGSVFAVVIALLGLLVL
ncbi:glycoside hydrolase family 16 protein [Amniculicola lignicola CBS 123094]|uniref:Glycoside hydrolase family 16 protein n=1 Tax=Amniculicola lignicola CBS 123094 TaxID=1392246 RepID=A0A6A5WSH1_9PLEO|nr:glycoside hydrolase family 16 protein [Amniculicola lignicola CBS 123094]